ncbi:MAG: TadE family protein [Acidimicrobiales bacterium]
MTHRALPTPSSGRRRLRRGDESGAAMVELAFALPIFVFLLYGLITFGVILAQKQQITNAAADGARAAVGQSSAAAAQLAAQTRVHNSLGAPAGSPANYTESYVTGSCSGGSGSCITVTITWDYKDNPLVPAAPGLSLATPNTFHSTAVVQYS